MARVVIGLSGGVDSSVAAWLLREQGHEVIGLFMINWHDTTGTLEGDCPWHDDRVFAELVARKLDIPLHTVDLSEQYRSRVVEYMFAEYARGRTPNPDVLCNREIKFDVFLEEALRLGADYVATGHYCRKAEAVGPDGQTVYRLLAGSDPDKDQSYFLCQLSQEQLRRALFPIGHLLKPEVRRIAAEQGLATARRKDSQGICFVGKVDLPVFLQQKLARREGNVHEILASWPGYGRGPARPTSGMPEWAGTSPAKHAAATPQPTGTPEMPPTAETGKAAAAHAGALPGAGSGSEAATTHAAPGSAPLFPATPEPGSALSSLPTEAEQGSAAQPLPTDEELAALAAPWRYTVRDGKKIGTHPGAHFFTIGQRKGLGIGGRRESLFILATDVAQNVIWVGEGDAHPGLWRPALRIAAGQMHWVNPAQAMRPGESRRFDVRIRYRQPLQPATLHLRTDGAFILFDTPQRGITPGQFAAWYDGDELVGSGTIAE